MAALDAAERELDAAFGRFETLVKRLQGWRQVEFEATRRVAQVEADAGRRVEAALAEAAQAQAERAGALNERSTLAEQLAELQRTSGAEGQRLAAELAATQGRLERVAAEAQQRGGAAERQLRELRAAAEGLQGQLRAAQAERERLEKQVPQLAAARAALERENLMLKGEAERQARELVAARTRAGQLETSARETVSRLQQLLTADG